MWNKKLAKHVTSGGVTFEVSTHKFFSFIYYPQCVWTLSKLHRCNFNMAIRHNRIFMLCHVVIANQLFLHVTVAYYFLLRVVFGVVVFFFTRLLVLWCVRHRCFSWLSLFLAILLISPPLSPPNGALCCGTSHLSLCIVTARHGNITMSLVRCVYSNLYWYTSQVTIYLLVGPTRYSGPVSRTLEILITPPYWPPQSILRSPSCSAPPN